MKHDKPRYADFGGASHVHVLTMPAEDAPKSPTCAEKPAPSRAELWQGFNREVCVFQALLALDQAETAIKKARAALLQSEGNDEASPNDADSGWIPWSGGECPVPMGTVMQYRLRCGYESGVGVLKPGYLRWNHSRPGEYLRRADIVAYRIASSAAATESAR